MNSHAAVKLLDMKWIKLCLNHDPQGSGRDPTGGSNLHVHAQFRNKSNTRLIFFLLMSMIKRL